MGDFLIYQQEVHGLTESKAFLLRSPQQKGELLYNQDYLSSCWSYVELKREHRYSFHLFRSRTE